MKYTISLIWIAFIIISCSNKSSIRKGHGCNELICIEVNATNIKNANGDADQNFLIKLTSSQEGNSIHQLFDNLEPSSQSIFKFNFFKSIKLIENDKDTISAVFSHMESNGNISPELTEIIGFDSLIDFSSQNKIQILFEDRFFSHNNMIIPFQ